MGGVGGRQTRERQVNIRLNTQDAKKFQYLMAQLHHQNVSDMVRDLLRNGYIDMKDLGNDTVDHIIKKLPIEENDEVKELQLNVRLSQDEHNITDHLMKKMKVQSVSKVVRNLISIYHFTLMERESVAKLEKTSDG